MKLFIIRLMIIACLWLLLNFVIRRADALLIAFVLEYIIEPFIVEKMR